MTAYYYCPCCVFGSTYLWLPPCIGTEWTESQDVQIVQPFGSNTAIIASIEQGVGTSIRLSADYMSGDPEAADVINLQEQLRDLKGRIFDFFIYSSHGFANCALRSLSFSTPQSGPDIFQRFEAEIFSESPGPRHDLKITFEDYENECPYAARVGRPQGTISGPGGSIVPGTPAVQTLVGSFDGIVEAAQTPHQFVVGGQAGKNWILDRVKIVSSDDSQATATTSVRVATAYPSGGGITATVAAGSTTSSTATGSVTVSPGSTLYVWAPSTGGHAAVQYQFTLRAAS